MGKGPRVLLVDDEPSLLAALARSLRREPIEILRASNGQEALALVELDRDDSAAAAAAVQEYLRRGGTDRASANPA